MHIFEISMTRQIFLDPVRPIQRKKLSSYGRVNALLRTIKKQPLNISENGILWKNLVFFHRPFHDARLGIAKSPIPTDQ